MKQYLLSFLLTLSCSFLYAQSETEPNNNFTTANALAYNTTISGTVTSGVDPDDYFVTVLPSNGTVKVYVEAKNISTLAGALEFFAYDRRKGSGRLAYEYVQSGSVAAGTTVRDTITLYNRGADTMYLLFRTPRAFSYQLRYEVVNSVPSDPEPNNSFETALPLPHLEEVSGQVGYNTAGITDNQDFFRAVLPSFGTIAVYIKATNYRGSTNYLRLLGHDGGHSGPAEINRYVGNSTAVANGVTLTDTIYLHSQARDTFYFYLEAGFAWNYTIKYEVINRPGEDTEPNAIESQAIPILAGEVKKGNIGYTYRDVIDNFDYYGTLLPEDGTVKVMIKARNTYSSPALLLLWGYSKGVHVSSGINKYITGGNIPAGATVYDTVYTHCKAVDSFFFRLNGVSFDYEISYAMVDTGPNDTEANDSYETATSLIRDSTYFGHIGYQRLNYIDQNDYYKTILPAKGQVKIFVEGANSRGTSTGYLHLAVTDQKQVRLHGDYLTGNQAVPAGTTIRDTIVLDCVATDTLYVRFASVGCWRYNFRVEADNPQPNAVLVHNVAGGLHEFVNQSTNAISYNWDLGDGTTTAAVAPPLKNYKPGSYQVRLTATGPACNFTDTDSVRFTVKGLDRFTPTSGGPGNIVFSAFGGGFTPGMQVLLKKDNLVFKDTISRLNQTGNIFTAVVDMHGAPPGVYDVEIKTADTTYLIPAGYTTVGLVDRLRAEIIGRDVIRRNTNSPYNVRIHNEGNTMAGLTEVYVLFPSYMNVTVRDSLAKPWNFTFTDLSLDTVPLFQNVTTERGYPINGKLYSFYLAGIPAGGFRDLSFMVNANLGNEKIYVWVKGPASGSGFRDWFDPCNEAKLKMVFDALVDGLSALPIAGCAIATTKGIGGTLYSAVTWLAGGGEAPSAASLAKSAWGIIKECASDASLLAGYPIAEIVDVVSDFAVLGSNIQVNAAAVKDACNDEPEDEEEKPVESRGSMDPNAKSGPAGFGTANFIAGSTKLVNYTVFFENLPTATLPAQEVIITDTLDKNVFDLSSFRSLRYSIGTKQYSLPTGTADFLGDVDFTGNLAIRVLIRLDTATGILTATLKTIDKTTGDVTEDPLAGFLPPNLNGPEGEGSVSFSLHLKNGLPDGTVFRNKASIVFDQNEPIVTNEWINTLDYNLPASTVMAAYQVNDSTVMVKTTGSDPSSGVRKYELWASENGGPFMYTGFIRDTFRYAAKLNNTYAFYVVAVDSVGNLEVKAPGAEATITLSPTLAVVLNNITATRAGHRNRIDWTTLHEDAGDRFEVEKSINGQQFVKLTSLAARGTASSYTVYDDAPAEGRNYYRLKSIEPSGKSAVSKVVSVYVLNNKAFAIEASPNPVQHQLLLDIHGEVRGQATLSLVNLMGVTLQQKVLTGGRNLLDMSPYPPGTYLLRYTDAIRTEVIKITKQ